MKAFNEVFFFSCGIWNFDWNFDRIHAGHLHGDSGSKIFWAKISGEKLPGLIISLDCPSTNLILYCFGLNQCLLRKPWAGQ